MLFPYSTDAPLYHLPIATVGLIVANFAIFLGINMEMFPGVYGLDDPWLLTYGDGLHPLQWLGSIFAHEGLGHLLGNMVFLWVFGLIVEGKVGFLRFLAIYLSIGIGESAIEQTLMLGANPTYSLGASSAIFGLMAVAAVWAPDNNVHFLFHFIPCYRRGSGDIDFPVLGVATFYIGWELCLAMLIGGFGGGVTSSFLHLLGAAVGLPIGVAFVKWKWVDCEGWDFFTRYGWNKKQLKQEAEAEAAAEARRLKKASDRDAQTLAAAAKQVDLYLADGQPLAAVKLYRKMATVGEGLRLSKPTLRMLIVDLKGTGHFRELAPLLVELIERSPAAADALRVQLAHVCATKLDRPGRALDLLNEVRPEVLTDKQLTQSKRITEKAHEMQQHGLVELDDGAW